MEIIEIIIENEDQVPEETRNVINQLTDTLSKNIDETIGEIQTTENQVDEENVEKNDDEVVPSTTPNPIEEQENVTDENTTVLVGRANIPFKKVNESEKEACLTIVNGPENIDNKKREFDNEDEEAQHKSYVNDEGIGDQRKKIKVTDSTDIPTVETEEPENHTTANSITTVV